MVSVLIQSGWTQFIQVSNLQLWSYRIKHQLIQWTMHIHWCLIFCHQLGEERAPKIGLWRVHLFHLVRWCVFYKSQIKWFIWDVPLILKVRYWLVVGDELLETGLLELTFELNWWYISAYRIELLPWALWHSKLKVHTILLLLFFSKQTFQILRYLELLWRSWRLNTSKCLIVILYDAITIFRGISHILLESFQLSLVL